MIHWLRHHEIDPSKWDQGMARCANASWYGLFSTLEATAPGWEALVDTETGAQMPLPRRGKFGINYLFQPFLVQDLGPYMPAPDMRQAAQFVRAIPARYRYADIQLAIMELPHLRQLRTAQRINHVLRLDRPLDALRTGYSENHRRSVRKAQQQGVRVESRVEGANVASFLERSEQFKAWRVDRAGRNAMRRVLAETEATGTGFGRMVLHGQVPVAAGWFVRYGNRLIFLKGLATPEGRRMRAMHGLIDQVIAEHAATGTVLDFAGGNDLQLARFYSGFGADPVVYLRALMNRLPALVRWLKP
ncbi:MAG: GNAT family N-acetyltransferase [Bacteroidetes bacterium]|nr:GNAT family N-acetyltransferase [Bacteroidota bacterium]